jgi:hypothetical protein
MKRTPSSVHGHADAVSFALACQQVIALRLMRIAFGGADGHREATRMVTEKATAAVQAHFAAAEAMFTSGPAGAAAAAANVYRRAVRANGRRLSRT